MDPDRSDAKSKETLESSFFESLWPLILDENKCHLESESTDFFVPRKPFDHLYWHSMLAKVGYAGYEQPYDLRCCAAARQEEEANEFAEKEGDFEVGRKNETVADFEATGAQAVLPVDKQIAKLHEEQEHRQRLAYKFANRPYPWTMKTPLSEDSFDLTPEIFSKFSCPMEMGIIHGIYSYECKFMLIDASTEVCVSDFQRWIKFRPYVQMLCLVRCPSVQRHLQLLNVFHTLMIEENMSNTWHEELQISLRTGLKEAKKLELIRNSGEAFVFVFSRYRGLCTCDTYKILRRM